MKRIVKEDQAIMVEDVGSSMHVAFRRGGGEREISVYVLSVLDFDGKMMYAFFPLTLQGHMNRATFLSNDITEAVQAALHSGHELVAFDNTDEFRAWLKQQL